MKVPLTLAALSAAILIALPPPGHAADRAPAQVDGLRLRLIESLDPGLLAGAVRRRQQELAASKLAAPAGPAAQTVAPSTSPPRRPVDTSAANPPAVLSAPAGSTPQPGETPPAVAAPAGSTVQRAELPPAESKPVDTRPPIPVARLKAPPPGVDLGAKMMTHHPDRLLPGGLKVKYLLFALLFTLVAVAAVRRFGWPRRQARHPVLRNGPMRNL